MSPFSIRVQLSVRHERRPFRTSPVVGASGPASLREALDDGGIDHGDGLVDEDPEFVTFTG